jgi:hypothetical protein
VTISRHVVAALLLGSVLQPEQRTVEDKSGMIRTQVGSTIDQEIVTVAWDALYDTTPYHKPVTSSLSYNLGHYTVTYVQHR